MCRGLQVVVVGDVQDDEVVHNLLLDEEVPPIRSDYCIVDVGTGLEGGLVLLPNIHNQVLRSNKVGRVIDVGHGDNHLHLLDCQNFLVLPEQEAFLVFDEENIRHRQAFDVAESTQEVVGDVNPCN